MELESLNAAFVIDTFLLLLIGIGPKIALMPFLGRTIRAGQGGRGSPEDDVGDLAGDDD